MEPLKLIALDEEDLAVLSSLLQDAVLRVADMTYVPEQKRFAAMLNRFDWEKAAKDSGKDYRRRRTALRFDRVFNAKLKNLKPRAGERVLSLLAVAFTPKESPGRHPHAYLLGRRLDPARSRMYRGRAQRSRSRYGARALSPRIRAMSPSAGSQAQARPARRS